MNLTSGNEMVDAMAEINFSGNIVPEAWFKNVLRPNGKNGKKRTIIQLFCV